MSIGTKSERGTVHLVEGYQEWKALANPDTAVTNEWSFELPSFEFAMQVVNFWLESSFFSVLEKLGKLSLFPAIVFFFVDIFANQQASP